jgi:hypothetical protein
MLPARNKGALLLKVMKKSVEGIAGTGPKILAGTGWELAILNWSFLAEPLRPAALVSLLVPLIVVATKAAAAKHATMIFMGVERIVLMVVCMYAGSTKVSNGF